ncbi:MAG: HYR domain-containing protein [Candidatus Thiodiazotropha taylori]|nr:HYR domain-containing protein [Candidatus Thiodiazotropha taylori]
MITLHAQLAVSDEVHTWVETQSLFSSNLDDAEPIDKYLSQPVFGHASTMAGETLYTAYVQSDGIDNHVYLLRRQSGNIEVWDDGSGVNGGWNDNLQTADSISNPGLFNAGAVDPAIAADSTGNVFIAFQQEDTSGSGNQHLYLARYNATSRRIEVWDGNDQAWSTDRTVINAVADGIDAERDSTGQTLSGSPKMVVNNNNDVFIAYLQSDGTQNHLYLTRYDASAVEIQGWDQAAVNNPTCTGSNGFTTVTNDFEDAGDEIDHIVAASRTMSFDMATGGPNGHVYFVYIQEDATPDFHLGFTRYNADLEVVQRWNQNAKAWTCLATDTDDDADFIDAKAVSASTANVTGTPSIALNSQGDAYIAYDLDDATPDSHIYLSRYSESAGLVECWDSATSTFSSATLFFSDCDEQNDSLDNQLAARDADQATLAIDGDDNVYVAFLQEDTFNQDHIYVTRFLPATNTLQHWSEDSETWELDAVEQRDATDMIDLNVSASSSSAFNIVANNNNDIYIAYIQQDNSGSNNHLKLTRYDASRSLFEGWEVDSLNSFTSDFSLVDSIDISTTALTSSNPDLQISRNGRIYIPYLQLREPAFGGTDHLQLNRLVPTNNPATGTVTISGEPTEGQTLMASAALSDQDGLGMITYWWRRDGIIIPAANSASYTLVTEDIGTQISVTASYTDGSGHIESVTSAATSLIAGLDSDGDGVPDHLDDFPNSAAATTDADGDSLADDCISQAACEADGITPDPSLNDFDNDGVIDSLDGDTSTDNNPPLVTAPADRVIEASGPLTQVDLGIASAVDARDGEVSATPDTPDQLSMIELAVGRHIITWSASDSSGNTGTSQQVVEIRDTTPPEVSTPADITIESTGTLTEVDLGNASAVDLVDGELDASPDTPNEQNVVELEVGQHVITWSATDTSGNSGSAQQTVTINQEDQNDGGGGSLSLTLLMVILLVAILHTQALKRGRKKRILI